MSGPAGSAVGVSCPFCHFPIKPGVGVVACEACHASHHGECWSENGGCAVTGCPQQAGVAGGDAPTAVMPTGPALTGASAPAWGPPPPPRAAQPTAGGPRWALVGVLAALVLLLAGAAGYFALAPGDDGDGDRAAATAPAAAPTAEAPAPTDDSGAPAAEATAPTAEDDEKRRIAAELVDLMAASARGRQANIDQRFASALQQRTAVWRRLQALKGADAAQESAIRSFEVAIGESRRSVIERRDTGSVAANGHDRAASRNKERFCAKWISSGMAELTGEDCDPGSI